MSATGYLVEHIPPGDERDELLGLVRIGLKFKAQHVGRRRDALTQYIIERARTLKRPTFAALLDDLETQAARRELYGPQDSPIDKVDRVWEYIGYQHPKRGYIRVQFSTLRNKLTFAKKSLREQFTLTAKPRKSISIMENEGCCIVRHHIKGDTK